MQNHQMNPEASLLLLPLYAGRSLEGIKLIGTGFAYTVRGRFFIITAGHVVLNHLREGQLALRGPTGYVTPTVKERSFFNTGGGSDDWADLAVAEVHPSVFAAMGNFVRFVDLPYITKQFVIKEGMHFAFVGFPKTLNREIVKMHQSPRPMLLVGRQVGVKHAVYKGYLLPPVHICGVYKKRSFVLSPASSTRRGPLTVPSPDGMSGGLVYRLNEEDYQKGHISFGGIIGVVIEHRVEHRVLVGMHISGVFEMLRARHPELSSDLPILNLETGSYTLG